MFPRGARFPAVKVPDVPGPGTYNPQDPEFDAYKRGAFLEKTNRFAKDKPSDIPGPGAYTADIATTTTKTITSTKSTSTDRYALLQRKVEELERIHAEGKKAHSQELERLKLALNRTQRTATEETERADKLKKQNDALDSRVQELKKTNASEQSELRDLRVKLRAAEHERTQVATKQGEAADARKALLAAETKRKDELRERDKRIVELEKALGAERKKRELMEAKVVEAKGKTDAEVLDARAATYALETQLQETRAEAQESRNALEDLRASAADTEESLLERLEQHRTLLARVAEEYGRLASTTVASSEHSRVKDERVVLQMRVFRLERKLANAEGQVVELASLIRYTKEENTLLSARLRDADADARFYSRALSDSHSRDDWDPTALRTMDDELTAIGHDLREADALRERALRGDARLWREFYRLRCDALLFHGSGLLKGLDDVHGQLQQSAAQLSEAEAKHADLFASLEVLRTAHANAQTQLTDATIALQTSHAAEETLRKQLDGLRAQSQADMTRVEGVLTKEKETTKRLAETVQKSRAAEDALQREIEELSSELSLAARYEEAYNTLTDDVDALLARNSLAEEEAQHLRRFNAEILGHNNPAQRIMYVDRIRRELHETKQKLLMLTRERDNALMDGDELRHELQMYKSVAVPTGLKPRTTVTRVGRMPSMTQSSHGSTNSAAGLSVKGTSIQGDSDILEPLPESEFGPDEMTLDEIM